MPDLQTGVLYYGDNLDVLRKYVPDASVDLIYLDPPFNSSRSYNVLFRESGGASSEAQIEAFEDTWEWGDAAMRAYEDVMIGSHQQVARMLQAMVEGLGRNPVTAYLTMMAPRLAELHRVLKPTGSLYLHCDPTAGAYLRVLLDAVFGPTNFRNEIVWQRTLSKGLMTRQLPKNHDIILCYQKTNGALWNGDSIFKPYDLSELDEKTAGKYSHRDPDGRLYQLSDLTNPNPDRPNLTYEFLGMTKVWRWTKERMQAAYDAGLVIQPRPGAVPRLKRYLDEQRGKPLGDVWTDIPPINSQAKERLGYPTQKPLALLERIINASSNHGDVVLDPFCGCGTAVHAAQKLGRRWIGIDITYLAIGLIRRRMQDAFPGLQIEEIGAPVDLNGARALAEHDKYQFQWWALDRLGAQPAGGGRKKGADQGIDGVIPFFTGPNQSYGRVIVSVKGGGVGVPMVRDLIGVLQREKEPIGVLLTLEPPTGPMRREAASAGFYHSEFWQKDYPKVQIITVEDLLHGKLPEMPPSTSPFAQAPRERPRGKQLELG